MPDELPMDQQLATPEAPSWAKAPAAMPCRRTKKCTGRPNRGPSWTRYSLATRPCPGRCSISTLPRRASIWRRCGSRSRGCKPIHAAAGRTFDSRRAYPSGISGTARIESLQTLGKSLEQAQLRLHDAECPPSGEQAELMYRAATTLEAMLAEVTELVMPLPVPELVEQLDAVQRLPAYDEAPESEEIGLSIAEPPANAEPSPRPSEKPPVVAARLHDEFDEQLLPIFLEEAAELLTQLYGCLREWRGEPADNAHRADLARLLHTLKEARGWLVRCPWARRCTPSRRLEETSEAAPGGFIDEFEEALDGFSHHRPACRRRSAARSGARPGRRCAVGGRRRPNRWQSPAARCGRAELLDQFVNQAGEIGIADPHRRRVAHGAPLAARPDRERDPAAQPVARGRIQAESQLQSRISTRAGVTGISTHWRWTATPGCRSSPG